MLSCLNEISHVRDKLNLMFMRQMNLIILKLKEPWLVAQLVEHPSKVSVWCNSTDMGLNPGAETLCGRNKS